MGKFNIKVFILCLILSVLVNCYWYFTQKNTHNSFTNKGIKTLAFIKNINKDEVTIFQKLKYTHVAKIYFITLEGDTIRDIIKDTWTPDFKKIGMLPFDLPYLTLDSVIYDTNNHQTYQLISEYNSYSKKSAKFWYFLFGPIFIAIWIYMLISVLRKKYYQLKTK